MDTVSSVLHSFWDALARAQGLVTLDRLIDMDDAQVRSHLGALFTTQLQSSPTVRDTFFGGAPAPLKPASCPWMGDVAAALVAWSLALVSGHGFSRTADQDRAKAAVQARLTPDDADFRSLAAENYEYLFPTHASIDGVAFSAYMADGQKWGRRLSDVMTSQEYIVKELAAYQSEPDTFFQRLFRNICKVRLLCPDLVGEVLQCWDQALHGSEKRIQWTMYEGMLAAHYTGQTFMAQVQAAVSESTATGTGYLPNAAGGSTSYTSQYTYGLRVENWLQRHASSHDFLTGTAPDNKVKAPERGSTATSARSRNAAPRPSPGRWTREICSTASTSTSRSSPPPTPSSPRRAGRPSRPRPPGRPTPACRSASSPSATGSCRSPPSTRSATRK